VAGTVARWTDDGQEVLYLLVTDGNRGTHDPALTPAAIAAIRRAEQRAAAAVVGVREVLFLGYDDATLQPTLEVRRAIAGEIRRYQPTTVVCQDPSAYWLHSGYINHPDHRAAGEACLAAVFPTASTRLAFPELLTAGLEPHAVREVYLTMTIQPDVWIDIEATMARKLAAWAENHSQVSRPGVVEQQIMARAREAAQDQPGMRYAEAFRRFTLL